MNNVVQYLFICFDSLGIVNIVRIYFCIILLLFMYVVCISYGLLLSLVANSSLDTHQL